jgi:hypothetical protein
MYLSAGSPELAQAAHTFELAARDHLKSLLDCNFHRLLACTFTVGFGLLLEFPEIVHDMREISGRGARELKHWLTPSIDRREYPRRDWVKKWAAFGWVLIVLGVMGEGYFEAQVSKYDSALSNLNDAILSEALKEATDAETKLLKLQPREKLLMGGCSFVKTVKPFAGQKIEIRTNFSGIKDPSDIEETREFVSSVDFLLGQVAGWSISKAQGDNGWGITLAVRRTSSPGTRNAANALASAFGDCELTNMQGNRPDSAVVDAGSVIDREHGPPDTIVLFIGERPH